MNWNPHMELHYCNTSYPYNSAGSFMEYVEGLTYEHVNFIFDGASHLQESLYPSMNTNFVKFGMLDPGSSSYYGYDHLYGFDNFEPRLDDRRTVQNSATLTNVTTAVISPNWEGHGNTTSRETPIECPRRHQNVNDFQVWQDNIDPDNMSYEELLELGETVGTQSRGLSQELISLLPVSKYKRCIFSRKKSGKERCVICQMDYKRRERLITLPCKHAYHVCCGTKWLSINKACPMCYTEVFSDAPKIEADH